MTGRGTRWVATVSGSGMEPFEVVAESRDELEQRLGDLLDLPMGRTRWTIEERSLAEPAMPPKTPQQAADQQLRLKP